MPPWLAPSEVLLEVLLIWIFSLGISMPPCDNFLVCLVVFLVPDYALHKLNPVRHELLHLWRTFLACWFILGKTLLCLILLPLLFLGCMPYGICRVPFVILCTSLLLHVVPMMLYCLTYCELLLLSLVGLTVWGCNQIFQICVCGLIREE